MCNGFRLNVVKDTLIVHANISEAPRLITPKATKAMKRGDIASKSKCSSSFSEPVDDQLEGGYQNPVDPDGIIRGYNERIELMYKKF